MNFRIFCASIRIALGVAIMAIGCSAFSGGKYPERPISNSKEPLISKYIGTNKIGEQITIEVRGNYPDLLATLKIVGQAKSMRVIDGGAFYVGNGNTAIYSYGAGEKETDLTALSLSKAEFNANMVCQKNCTKRVPKKFVE